MLRVLTYHRIDNIDASVQTNAWLNPRLINASPELFQAQMRFLAKHYVPVSLQDVIEAAAGRRTLNSRSVLVTFDDGYLDFRDIALPILRQHGIPATLFVPTSYPDHPERSFWWDRIYRSFERTKLSELADTPFGPLGWQNVTERAAVHARLENHVKRLPHDEGMRLVDRICAQLGEHTRLEPMVLGWDALRALHAEGVALVAHSHTHPLLTHLPVERVREEVRTSQQTLRREIGYVYPAFSYPNGSHNDAAVQVLREEGFLVAFTQIYKHNDVRSCDLLRLGRVNMTRRMTVPWLRLRLQPWFPWLDSIRKRKRYAQHQWSPLEQGAGQRAAATRAAPHIACTMSRFPKITETFILYEILALEDLGWTVEVFPLLRVKQTTSHAEVTRILPRARFKPFVSPAILKAQLVFAATKPARYFGTLYEVLRHTWGSRNFFFGTLAIFPKSVHNAMDMQRLGVRHLHAHFATHPAMSAFIVHRLTDIPFSFTAHGSDLHVERRMLDRKVRAAAFTVTVSEYNRQLIIDACGPWARERVHVIHCGVDPDVFSVASNRSSEHVLQILCVASFEDVKGHRYLIAACEQLRRREVPFECHLIGDGPRQSEVVAQIASAGLEDVIHIHGPKARSEVVEFLGRSHVVVLASVPTPDGKREGIPVVLMEGMASGLPVVASRLSGIPELVDDDITGILVEPRDSTGLAAALARLAGDSAQRQRMGRAGREKVRREFNLRQNTRTLAKLFERAIQDHPVVSAPNAAAVENRAAERAGATNERS